MASGIKSLEIGAQDMLATEITFEPEAFMTTINVPDPEWNTESPAVPNEVFNQLNLCPLEYL
jgi:hypothetical protein